MQSYFIEYVYLILIILALVIVVAPNAGKREVIWLQKVTDEEYNGSR